MQDRRDRYFEGLDMEQFHHISVVSYYNNNYYKGFDKDLLFAKSDDDDETEWYIVLDKKFTLLGYSYVSNGDKLIKHED